MEEIYANAELEKPDDRGEWGPLCVSGLRRFNSVAFLCLGLLSLLLFAVMIGLSVQCHNSARESFAIKAKLSSLTEERNLLNASLTEMTKKLKRLREKTCPADWTMFGCSCYFFSTERKSWALSRQDCRDRGADLVIIDSLEEEKFLTNVSNHSTWIGLSDRDHEGTWKWTDGTPLTLAFWAVEQPDNGGGDPRYEEEDCVHFVSAKTKPEKRWNDVGCHLSLFWICEK